MKQPLFCISITALNYRKDREEGNKIPKKKPDKLNVNRKNASSSLE